MGAGGNKAAMAGKTLNKKTLKGLVPKPWPNCCKSLSKAMWRVRMALSSDQSPKEAAADIRKRLGQIRRAKSWISP